jgi:hypothetical protein
MFLTTTRITVSFCSTAYSYLDCYQYNIIVVGLKEGKKERREEKRRKLKGPPRCSKPTASTTNKTQIYS